MEWDACAIAADHEIEAVVVLPQPAHVKPPRPHDIIDQMACALPLGTTAAISTSAAALLKLRMEPRVVQTAGEVVEIQHAGWGRGRVVVVCGCAGRSNNLARCATPRPRIAYPSIARLLCSCIVHA